MKYFSRILLVLIFASVFTACKPRKKATAEQQDSPALKIYRASVTQLNDLVHTRLEIEPDFLKKELRGTAKITLKPHFYPVDSLILDAQYMRIQAVRIVRWKQSRGTQYDTIALKYGYDSLKLSIKLDKQYNREDLRRCRHYRHYIFTDRFIPVPPG